MHHLILWLWWTLPDSLLPNFSMFVEIGTVFPKQKETHSLLKINECSCEYPISCDIRTAIYTLAFRQCSVGPNLCHPQAHRGSNRGKAPFCASACWCLCIPTSSASTTALRVFYMWRKLMWELRAALWPHSYEVTETELRLRNVWVQAQVFPENIWKVFRTVPDSQRVPGWIFFKSLLLITVFLKRLPPASFDNDSRMPGTNMEILLGDDFIPQSHSYQELKTMDLSYLWIRTHCFPL